MPWLLFALALAALAGAFTTTSVALLVVCLFAALGLSLAAVMQLLARRIDGASGNAAMMVDPQELQRMREQAEARRLAAAQAPRDVAAGENR